jgi:hypothetical protein
VSREVAGGSVFGLFCVACAARRTARLRPSSVHRFQNNGINIFRASEHKLKLL